MLIPERVSVRKAFFAMATKTKWSVFATAITLGLITMVSGVAAASEVRPETRLFAASSISHSSIAHATNVESSPKVVTPREGRPYIAANSFFAAATTTTTTIRSGEGMIAVTTRVCGSSRTWQANAAANGITPPNYVIRLYTNTGALTQLRIDCGLTAAPAAQAPQPQVAQPSNGAWVHPLPGRCVTSGFGWRSGRIHNGVDMPAGYGTDVLAAASGTAYWGSDPGGAGLYLTVNHGNGLWTTYFHLSSRVVGNGQWVHAGQHIGEVGTTGNSTGPHLHFEVHPWGQWVKHWSDSLGANAYVNPVSFMADRGVRFC